MMSAQPKIDGSPNKQFFESPETVALFEGVRTWLLKNCKKYVQTDPPTNKSLASLVVQLIQFQEENFGRNVRKPPPLTRLPARCFLDFKPGGALCHILSTIYKYKSEQGWRRFDLQSPSRMDRNVEMFMNVEKALIQNKCLVMPNVFIRSDVEKSVVLATKVKETIKRHQGTVSETEEDVTHIIYPVVDPLDEEYARAVYRRSPHTLLHWYYFPDSRDSWDPIHIPSVQAPESLPPVGDGKKTSGGAWRVSAAWVLDLDMYNEWMNEEDYEVDEAGKKKVHKLRISEDDLEASTTSSGSSAASAAPSTPTPAATDKDDEAKANSKSGKKRKKSPSPQPTPKLGKRKRNPPATPSTPASSVPSKKVKTDEESDDLTKDMEDPPAEPIVSEVTPSSAVAKSSSGVSKRDNEAAPLKSGTVADLDEETEKTEGDSTPPPVSTKDTTVVDADAKPATMGPPPTSHFHVLTDTPSGLQPVNPPKTAQPSAAKILLDMDKKVEPATLGLAAKKEGELPGNFGLKLDQYAKKPAALRNKQAASLSRDWTEQETLLLLEALEMHKDDWNKMSGRPSYRSGPYDRSSSRGRSKTRHIRSKQPRRAKRPEETNRLLLQSLRPHQQIGIEYERTNGNMFEVRVQMGRVSAVLQGPEKGEILEKACGDVIEKMMVDADERNEDMGKFASYCTRKVLMDAKKQFVVIPLVGPSSTTQTPNSSENSVMDVEDKETK